MDRCQSVKLDEFWIDKYEVTNRQYKAFVDVTGRPGPADWSLGNYPEGEDDLPVRGVSWFEASAYAAWADKSLPTDLDR